MLKVQSKEAEKIKLNQTHQRFFFYSTEAQEREMTLSECSRAGTQPPAPGSAQKEERAE